MTVSNIYRKLKRCWKSTEKAIFYWSMESAIKENVGNSYFKLLNQKTLEDNSEICTNNK